MSIASEIQRLQSAKADLKTAIEAKGVTVPSNATIDTYDDYVSQISGGGGGGMIRYTSGTPYCDSTNLVVSVQNEISVDSGTSWVNSGSPYVVIVESGASQCQSILPAGYTQVEYVENQNQAYINTLFKPDQDTRIVCEMQCVTSTNSVLHFGTGGWDKVDGMWLTYETGINGTLHISWLGKTTWSTYSSVIGDYNKHIYDWNKNNIYIDNVLVASDTLSNYSCPDNLAIFTTILNGTSYESALKMLGKLYSLKIYDNGTLVRDMIPCTRDSDSKAGVYDIVNDVFYSSASSGYELVAGDPV